MPKSSGGHREPIPLNRLLDLNGDGTGGVDASNDYSSAPVTFYIQPPAGEVYIINEVIVHITSSTVFDADKYGNLTALTNGLQINVTMRHMEGVTLLPNGVAGVVKQNDEFLLWGPNAVKIVSFTGGTKESMVAAFRAENFGKPILLNGSLGHKIEVVCDDNFATLLTHNFAVHGYT